MQKLGVLLALSGAFVAGAVLADADAPKVVKAQSFVLVDTKGQTVGVFGVEKRLRSGAGPASVIALYDAQGRVIWRATEALEPITAAR
jgi:hypothetical protein